MPLTARTPPNVLVQSQLIKPKVVVVLVSGLVRNTGAAERGTLPQPDVTPEDVRSRQDPRQKGVAPEDVRDPPKHGHGTENASMVDQLVECRPDASLRRTNGQRRSTEAPPRQTDQCCRTKRQG